MYRRMMVFALAVVVACLVGTIAWAAGSDFLGTWLNVDPNTGGLTKLEIWQSGSNYYVAGFGACVPTDCEWGTVDLHLMGSDIGDTNYRFGLAVWDHGFVVTYLVVQVEGDVLVAILYDVFAPGDSRANYRSIYLLKKP